MLILAGMGLNDEKDISLREIEEARNCDEIFLEKYTNQWLGDVKKLEKIIGKKINVLERNDLETESDKIIKKAVNKKIILFVPGDPLVATTHISIVQQARRLGIEVKIIHNSSIISAVGESGLHLYKFGATVTIPSREKTGGFLPKSVYDSIQKNKSLGLHTLCLIDLVNGKSMDVKEALRTIIELDKKYGDGTMKNQKIVVMCRLGSNESKIFYSTYDKLLNIDYNPPCVIIIPGNLHFSEKETLDFFEIK